MINSKPSQAPSWVIKMPADNVGLRSDIAFAPHFSMPQSADNGKIRKVFTRNHLQGSAQAETICSDHRNVQAGRPSTCPLTRALATVVAEREFVSAGARRSLRQSHKCTTYGVLHCLNPSAC